MDEILLVLMVAVVGSLLLPAMQLARVVKRGQTPETIGEIKEQTDHNPSAGIGDFKFRPLTQEEKKAFVNSLDAEGRQILAELAGSEKHK